MQRVMCDFCDSIEMRNSSQKSRWFYSSCLCSTAASNLVLDRLNQIGEVVAFRRRDWAVEIEVAAGRRRRAQQVSRGHSCNLMWHGFGQL